MAGPFKVLVALDRPWRKAYRKVHAFVDRHVAIAIDRQRRLVEAGKGDEDSKAREKYILSHQVAMEMQDPYDLRSEHKASTCSSPLVTPPRSHSATPCSNSPVTRLCGRKSAVKS